MTKNYYVNEEIMIKEGVMMNLYLKKMRLKHGVTFLAAMVLYTMNVQADLEIIATKIPEQIALGQKIPFSFRINNTNASYPIEGLSFTIDCGDDFTILDSSLMQNPSEVASVITTAYGQIKGSGGALMEEGDPVDHLEISGELIFSPYATGATRVINVKASGTLNGEIVQIYLQPITLKVVEDEVATEIAPITVDTKVESESAISEPEITIESPLAETTDIAATPNLELVVEQPVSYGVVITGANETAPGLKNGSLTITAQGGVPPYEFSIRGGTPETFYPDNTFASLAPGTYAVVVKDAEGNITLPQVHVITPAVPLRISTAITPTQPGGNDGSITITAVGGVPPYTYALTVPNSTDATQDSVFKGLSAGKYQVLVTDQQGTQAFSDVITVPPALPFYIESVATTPISYKGASDATISVNVKGGLEPVLFTLDGKQGPSTNPVFTQVGPGVHTITVTDASVPARTVSYITQKIDEPKALTIATTQVVPALGAGQANGKIIVLAAGGMPPYTYSSNGGATFGSANEFSHLAAGDYSIVIKDAKGCITSTLVHVTQPNPVTITKITKQDVTSFGGSDGRFSVVVTGGTGNYRYSLDAGISFTPKATHTGLTAGKYFITVTDQNGSTAKAAVTINQPEQLIITDVTKIKVKNKGSTLTIFSQGGTPPLSFSINGGATFRASNIFNNVKNGACTVVVKDALGCKVSTLITVS